MKKDISDKRLSAIIDVVDEDAPFILFIPGMSGMGISERYDSLARIINRCGYNLLRFKFSWESHSTINEATLGEELNDAKYALSLLTTLGYNVDTYGIIAKSFGSIKAFLMPDNKKAFMIHLGPVVFLGKPTYEKLINTIYGDIADVRDLVLDSSDLAGSKVPNLILCGDKDNTIDRGSISDLIMVLGQHCKSLNIADGSHDFNFDSKFENILTNFLVTL